MNQVVSLEQATKEVTDWLDYKKVSSTKRDERKPQIETLIGAICEGSLTLNDYKFRQKLKVPFGKDVIFEELEYLPRIPIDVIAMHLRSVKSDDPDGRLLAHVAALTTQARAVLGKMDTEDYATAQAIAYFFL